MVADDEYLYSASRATFAGKADHADRCASKRVPAMPECRPIRLPQTRRPHRYRQIPTHESYSYWWLYTSTNSWRRVTRVATHPTEWFVTFGKTSVPRSLRSKTHVPITTLLHYTGNKKANLVTLPDTTARLPTLKPQTYTTQALPTVRHPQMWLLHCYRKKIWLSPGCNSNVCSRSYLVHPYNCTSHVPQPAVYDC